jgi:orotidine-5'-phosphate decarboxylase
MAGDSKDKIIFALDVEHFSEAQKWVNLLKDRIGIFKVGKQLFTHAGPKVVDMIRQKGQKVFLDLKYHDIPNTVAKAAEEATKLNVTMFNLHALGGFEMMKKTVEASRGMAKRLGISKPFILAVTVLTSMDENTQEIGVIREQCGEKFLIVTPGIRAPSDKKDDQKRTLTPKEAISAGANYLVIGRPIKEAKDPLEAVQKIIEDIS